MWGQQNIKTIIKKTKYEHLCKFVHSRVKAQQLMSDNQKNSLQ